MTQVIAPFASRYLRIARMLPPHRVGGSRGFELNREQLRTARHMAHDGATAEEIHNALGLICAIDTTRKKLMKANIHYRPRKHGHGRRR